VMRVDSVEDISDKSAVHLRFSLNYRGVDGWHSQQIYSFILFFISLSRITDCLSQFRSEQTCHVEGPNKQEVLN
jgi:hypothetical protein